jgi:hypothetical protein
MKQIKHLGVLALLLVSGMVGCTPAPTAPPSVPTDPPPAPTDPPADTAVPTVAEDASPWEVVLQTEVEQPVRMAAFLNDKVGFTGGGGEPGRAHYTDDGSQTWTLTESSVG